MSINPVKPTVGCICLTANRPEMTIQAIEAFRAQDYDPARRWLVVYDTGDPTWFSQAADRWQDDAHGCIMYCRPEHLYMIPRENCTIGELRNQANSLVRADVIVHWDSDDWSHQARITEQVADLQRTDADVIGYNEVVFWREPYVVAGSDGPWDAGEAWRYRDNRNPMLPYAIGASLCYWRRTWEKKKFAKAPVKPNASGEDWLFLNGLRCASTSSITPVPRMICRIHANNSADYSSIDNPRVAQTAFTRAPEFDQLCMEVFK